MIPPVAQLHVKRRDVLSLDDELATALREILQLSGEVDSLLVQNDRLKRERKNLMEILKRGGHLHRRKRASTYSKGAYAPREL